MDENDLLALITKDLVDQEIFTEDTTPEDFRSILKSETLEAFTKLTLSASGSANPSGEQIMPPEREIDPATLPEEVAEYIKELEDASLALAKSLDEKTAEVADLTSKLEAVPTPPPAPEDIFKGLPPEVAEIIKSGRDRLEKAEQALAAERHERMRREYIAKARAYDGLTDDVEGLADTLLAIDEALPAEGDKVRKVLETALKRVDVSKLFGELGGDFTDGGDAWEKATTIAKGLVDSGKFDNIEVARAHVWDTQPDLYAEYQADRAASRRR